MKSFFLLFILIAVAACRPHAMNNREEVPVLLSLHGGSMSSQRGTDFEFFSKEAQQFLQESEDFGEKEPIRTADAIPEKPSEIQQDRGEDSTPDPTVDARDFVEKGKLVPSIYFKSLVIEDEKTCRENSKVNLMSTQGHVLMKVCRSTFSTCLMEGSCQISQNGIERSFNIVQTGKRPTFVEILDEGCQFGLGVRGICLDPFYTVAADMRYHRAGDVIYIPALVGQVLPNGEKHSGFMVVRDRGGAIVGANRFDFFSGSVEWKDPRNTFTRMKLNDKRTRLQYYLVKGESAKKVLSRRAFPKIPQSPSI